MANRTASPPSLPPDAIEAITSKPADAPRRCFICLTDEDPSDPPNSWVDPCPCTLEAHHDCILSWVTDCERSSKPLRCPVCKSDIEMEGSWDPVVAVHDYIQGRFTRGSPWMLFTSATLGVASGLQAYGAMSIAAFAGREALLQLLLGDTRTVDVNEPQGFSGERLRNGLMLMQIAPALLLHRITPSLVDTFFSPQIVLYGVYHFKTDPNFISWPPSPQLAITAFPILRRAYYNFYKEFIMPREVRLNRIMAGLPPDEPRRNEAQNRGQRNGDGGVIGFLQNIIDALDPEDERPEGQRPGIEIVQEDGPMPEGAQEGDIMVDVELVIEEAPEEEAPEEEAPQEDAPQEHYDVPEDVRAALGEMDHDPDNELPEEPNNDEEDVLHQEEHHHEHPPAMEEEDDHNHEAPQAPPANRPGLGAILHSVSNSLVSALSLPGVCFVMGEALRVTLPGSRQHGLLKQQWGRSLVGGCMYVVMKDVVRLYAKHRKVQALANRKVKNVDRARRNQG